MYEKCIISLIFYREEIENLLTELKLNYELFLQRKNFLDNYANKYAGILCKEKLKLSTVLHNGNRQFTDLRCDFDMVYSFL